MAELKVIPLDDHRDPASPAAGARRAWVLKSVLLRLYRLAVVVAIVWLVHRHHARLRVDGDAPIKVEEVRPFFPAAGRLEVDSSARGGLFVLDGKGNTLGYVVRTSPASDKIIGFCGPTDTLVALTPDFKVAGIKVRSSRDTKEHVGNVVADEYFMGTWNGKAWDEVAGMDPRAAGIEGVSGASLTSLAIANGIRRRFDQSNQTAAAAKRERFHVGWNDAG